MALTDPVAGALAMAAFGVGTLPALSIAALTVRRLAPRTLAGRRVLALAVLCAGLWSVAVRSGTLPGGHAHDAPGGHGAHNLRGR